MKELVSKYSIRIQLFTAISILISVVYITMNVTSAFERVARIAEGNNIDIKEVLVTISSHEARIGDLEVDTATCSAKLDYLIK